MAPATPKTIKKASRLLAALDGTDEPLVPIQLGGIKRTNSNGSQEDLLMRAGGSNWSQKKRALGLSGPGTTLSGNPSSPVDEDDEDMDEDAPIVPPHIPALDHLRQDFRLNYDKESPLIPFDRGGPDQQMRLADFVTKSIENNSGTTVQKAMESLGLHDKQDLLPGMEVRLLPHQAIGVSWMVSQERNTPHKGGILADDMGLGKTVQMIATMCINQPTEEDTARTTLIVVPAALLLQWKEELLSKTNEIFSVHIHHGKDKLKTVDEFRKWDVIITTYHTLIMDFAIPVGENEPDDVYKWLSVHGGVTARVKWYRVINDEAQFIRNRATKASKAVAMLRAKYRWCLTGTPVTNTLADIYGLLRFGHFRPFNDWDDFNRFIGKVQLEDAPLAGLRAQEVLKPLMIRRTKNSELEGRPILELPSKDIEIVTIDFSQDEREIYDGFETRAQNRINKFIKENTVHKNSEFILVLILRLRQVCCHPYLILSEADQFEDPTMLLAGDQEKELARALKTMGILWVNKIKEKFLKRAMDDEEVDDAVCANCGEMFVNDSGNVLACSHEVCFECLLEMRNAPPSHDGIFAEGDEKSTLQVEKDYEAAITKGLRPCPKCKTMNDLRAPRVFKSSAFEPSEDEFRNATRRNTPKPSSSRFASRSSPAPVKTQLDKKPKIKSLEEIIELSSSEDELPDIANLFTKTSPKAKLKKNVIISDDEEEGNESLNLTIAKYKKKAAVKKETGTTRRPVAAPGELNAELVSIWRKGDNDMEPSAKMLAMIDYLKEWEAAGDKSIVYSQWTSMLDLIETLFARYGIQSLRYDGKMTREAREAVLARFRKPGGPKVILISTKSGGVGLNLVSANHIVNMDLSWNYASESQAYDRVHRLGQEKDVTVKRLVVRHTIEERMLRLQETKMGLSDAALGEGGGIKLHKLSVKQLKALFGMVPPDKNKNGRASPNAGP
ncbi:hypothetical protein QCA50_019872 [Cerrena zonata]|uniref:Uncharacterized protein n=1 Tax=Cerrena zonata TaxID=2478898 RepID=A0AAW0FHT4_9APHY